MTAAEPTVTGDLILRNARIAGAEESRWGRQVQAR